MLQTKKLSTCPTSALATADRFPVVDTYGTVTTIGTDDFKTALFGGQSIDSAMDGIYIMYHRKSDGVPLMVKPHKWPYCQSQGEVADGVVVVEGDKSLVVAPTESAALPFSSATPFTGDTPTNGRLAALDDWQGKTHTDAIIAASSSAAVTNTTGYAAGYCHAYSRANANGVGLTAGKWWLPSVGEFMMIYANMHRINYALGLIAGSTPISFGLYWTSTENSATNAYVYILIYGQAPTIAKTTATLKARPVSAFIV